MRGQRKNPRKAVQPFENKKRKIDIFKNYEANGVEKIQRKLEIFSTLISKKSISIKLRATKKAVAALHQSNGRFRCLNFIRGSGKNAYVATPFGKIYFECDTSIPEGFCAFECVLFRQQDKQEIIITCQKQKKKPVKNTKPNQMTGISSLSRKLMNSSNWSGCEANASKSYNKIISGGLPSLGKKK